MKTVGFLKPVKADWLNLTVKELKEGKDKEEIRKSLKEYISNFYESKDTVRKAAAVLMNTWVDIDDENKNLRDLALSLFDNADEDEKIALHYGLMIAAFPIFYDVVFLIGKILYIDENFKIDYIKKRIYEKWGERQTVRYSIDRIIMSLKEWGLIENEKIGVYKIGKKIYINNDEIKAFLISSYLKVSERSYVDINEINNIYSLFPFVLDMNLSDIKKNNILSINNIGSSIVIGIS